MASNRTDIYEQLERLRESYAASLSARLDDVAATAASLEAASSLQEERDRLSALRGLAHKLAGSGATFGFSEISTVALLLEQLADDALKSDARLPADAIARIFALIADLRRAAEGGRDAAAGHGGYAQPAGRQPGLSDAGETCPILLIEDDEALGRQLKADLEKFAFSVTTVSRSSFLCEEAARPDVAAVVMDVEFGDDAGARVKQRLQERHLDKKALIFISERADAETRLAAVRAGGAAYLTKPLNIMALVDTLDRLTGRDIAIPYRVLIIDDDPNMARYSEIVLKGAGMITRTVTHPMEALGEIEAFSPELILLDLYMQDCSGSELAMVIRQNPALACLPIVFLSNESERECQLDAMRQGGDDFLTKSMPPDHLVTAVKLRATRFRALRALIVRDSMTGLLNHSATQRALETEIERARRTRESLTFALIDIDRFKSVNDMFGHQAGDWIIKSIARLLKQRLRGVDIIGRMGGEEFAVVLFGADGDAAFSVLNEIRLSFSEIQHRSEGKAFNVTVSCGIAEYPMCPTASALMKAADKALYEAKEAGRDRVVLHAPAAPPPAPREDVSAAL